MDTKSNSKLSVRHKIGYGLGDAGGCMTFALMGTMFSKYCTDALGVSTGLLALLLLIWNVWDFINDPIMGALMDRSFARNRNPKGKFRPWLLRSSPLVCITFIALWSIPSFLDGIALIGALFGLKILYEACYTMFNIPMGSLLSAMANNDHERAALSSARGIGSAVGNMVPMMVMPALLKAYGENNGTGYAIGAVLCAAVGFVMCLLHYRLTEERNIVAGTTGAADNIKVTDILGVFRANRPFVALCIHGVFICMMQYVGNTLSSYMYSDVLGDIAIASYGTILSAPFMLAIFVLGPMAAKKLGLEKIIRHGLLFSCLLYILLFVLHMVTNVNPWIHVIWSSVAMGLASISIYMQWGLVGEAIDYNEMITGKRTEGSIYGTFNLSRRVGQAIGNSAALLLLGWVGYDAAQTVQSAATVTGIKALCVLLPGIFVLGSWAAFKFLWNMDAETRVKLAAFKAGKQ